uniref:Uncharacterized protein n=1 Tax=Anguilla anguilla TaxID=7936 RepID=A0A0E9STJ5_ANGAN
MQEETGANSTDSLVQMLMGFDAFPSDLEAKYSRKGGKVSMGKRRKK